MNPIDKAIKDVMFSVPKAILHYAFVTSEYHGFRYPVSLEHVIREQVVDARVIPDCNLVGGVEVEIDITGLTPIYNDGINRVFKIPKSMTENRSITGVFSASYDYQEVRGYLRQNASTYTTAGQKLLNTAAPEASNATIKVSLVGDNTVLIKDWVETGHIYKLRVRLGNDGNMANLDPATIPAFSKLVEFAVKAYIYNNTIIPMDRGQLSGGMELGSFKDIIDGYSDSNQLYQEYLTDTWARVAFMDDKESYHRMLRATIRPG